MLKLMMAVLLVGAVACGGKAASSETTPAVDDDSSSPPPDTSGNMVPPEKIDEINNLLDRKRGSVCRCLTMAVDNKDLPKGAQAKTLLEIEVQPSGQAGEVKVVKASLDNKPLLDCVITRVREIEFPKIPAPYRTSYTFGCEAN